MKQAYFCGVCAWRQFALNSCRQPEAGVCVCFHQMSKPFNRDLGGRGGKHAALLLRSFRGGRGRGRGFSNLRWVWL